MAIDDRLRLVLPRILSLTVIGAVAGAAYGLATAHGASLTGLARGALSGAFIAAIITSLDAFVLKAPGAPLTRTPFLLNVGVRSLVYLVVFLLVIPAGNWLLPNPDAEVTINISRDDIVFSFAVLFVVTFLLEVNTLLGQNVLLAFITGRYHRPRVEQRVFLIIDMKNSTAAAERLGEVAFHGLLNRLIGDLSGDRGAQGRDPQICRRRADRDLAAGRGPQAGALPAGLLRRHPADGGTRSVL